MLMVLMTIILLNPPHHAITVSTYVKTMEECAAVTDKHSSRYTHVSCEWRRMK